MKLIILLIVAFYGIVQVKTHQQLLVNNSNQDFDNDKKRMELSKGFLMYPGTKWCGPGNNAADFNDLGTEKYTDECCRSHDHCPDVMKGFETKNNLTNTSFFSRLHCNCDMDFYSCLKSVNTSTSKQIGHIYFTALGRKCYKNEYPVSDCAKYTYFPKKKCVKYIFDKSKKQQYQWFDTPNF